MPEAAQLADGGVQKLDPEATLLTESRAVLLGRAARTVCLVECRVGSRERGSQSLLENQACGKVRVGLGRQQASAARKERSSGERRKLRSLGSRPGS